MKKFVSLLLIYTILFLPVYAKTDKNSKNYLKNKKHLALMNPLAESIAQKIIKKTLKKEIGKGHYKVKLESYTLGSLKKGIFKSLEIIGKDIVVENIPVSYLNLKTVSDYNWIDYNENPMKIKSDITFSYNLELTEDSLNEALENQDYQDVIKKVNKRAYPLFEMQKVKIRIKNNKVYIIMDYNLPLSSSKKTRKFIASSGFKIENGKIQAHNVHIDKSYGNIPLEKVANLINLLDPLSFTLKIIKDDDCKGQVESVKIENDKININGKLFILKGE